MRFRKIFYNFFAFIYEIIFKPVFFKINPEIMHAKTVGFGEFIGKYSTLTAAIKSIFNVSDSCLEQTICGIKFTNPVGLSAGFDYEARLTQILPAFGFGFQSIGTITNLEYEGNSRPILGRLPRSKSLMVNKGFKNLGAKKTIQNLTPLLFKIPVGVSIGRTNLATVSTQEQSVSDIVQTFRQFEESALPFSYYELNISCPNLYGSVSFYPTNNLEELLSQIDLLKIKRPIFIKMPIEKNNIEFLEMLNVISKHSIAGIIIGNLQKDRNHPSLVREEVERFKVGNFSGKPTYDRSNELIKLAYKNFNDKLIVIGCGGVFSGEDAYKKITLGASLIQLITGLIYKGPQLITQINLDLIEICKKEGYTSISQAIGKDNT